MKLARAPDFTKPISLSQRFAIFGNFNICDKNGPSVATQTAARLLSNSCPVATYTFSKNGFSKYQTTSSTPLKAERSLALLDRTEFANADFTIIFAEDVFKLQTTTKSNLRKVREIKRRFAFIGNVINRSKRVIFLGKPVQTQFCLQLAKTLVANKKSDHSSKIFVAPSISVAATKTGLNQLVQGANLTTEGTFWLMKTHASGSIASSSNALVLDLLDLSAENHGDLREIITISRIPALRQHPLVKRLRAKDKSFKSTTIGRPPFPILNIANSITEVGKKLNLPISKYMHHLSLLKKIDTDGETDPSNLVQLVDWYENKAHEEVPSAWVPKITESDFHRPGPVNSGQISENAFNAACEVAQFIDLENDKPLTQDRHNFWSENPYGPGPSRMAVLFAFLLGRVSISNSPETIWEDETLEVWFENHICALIPNLSPFSTMSSSAETNSRHFPTLVGYPQSQTGLGTNLRMTKTMFEALGISFETVDVDHKTPPQIVAPDANRKVSAPFALHHINADRVPLSIISPEFAYRNDQFHIGYLLWELEKLPKEHHLALELLDEIWVPTSFVANVYRTFGQENVHIVGKGIPELGRASALPRLITENDPFTALICFDFHSSVERKNPLCAVRAFLEAFPLQQFQDCRLIVKTTPHEGSHWGDPDNQMEKIRKIAANDPRISIIERAMTSSDLWHLLRSVHCLLSTHRAEGFGYIPAYALSIGLPVAITNYGGSLDFCTEETSFPISFNSKRIETDQTIFDVSNATWADPSVEHTSKILTSIYSDYQSALLRAARGRALIHEKYSMAAYSKNCVARLSANGLI